MDAKLKQTWIDALRSGKYKQGKNILRFGNMEDTDAFCCLGVLADLIEPHTWTPSGYVPSRHCWVDPVTGDRSSDGLLPDCTVTRVGLPFDQVGRLIRMNDAGDNFGEIAKWIKENVDGEQA